MKPNSIQSWGLRRFPIATEFTIYIFSLKTAFERRKSATNFRFEQTSCGTISQPLLNNLLKENCLELVDVSR